MATLKKKMALIKEMKVDIEQRDKRIDELLLEVESLKGTISELEALRDQLQQELSDSREQNEKDQVTIEEQNRQIAMLDELLHKRAKEKFNRGIQTKRIKTKEREIQTIPEVKKALSDVEDTQGDQQTDLSQPIT